MLWTIYVRGGKFMLVLSARADLQCFMSRLEVPKTSLLPISIYVFLNSNLEVTLTFITEYDTVSALSKELVPPYLFPEQTEYPLSPLTS